MTASVIRRAVPEDLETLWEFLAMAAYEPHAAAAKAVPMIGLFLTVGCVPETSDLSRSATASLSEPPGHGNFHPAKSRGSTSTTGHLRYPSVSGNSREVRVWARYCCALSLLRRGIVDFACASISEAPTPPAGFMNGEGSRSCRK
jgi:hypothetical protein